MEAIPEDDEAGRAKAKTYYEALRERIFREQVLRRTSAVPTAARSTRSAPSRSRSAFCRAPTARRIFTRGETQALVTTTLGTSDDMQRLEALRRRSQEALHAALQLPAVLGGRSRLSCAAPAAAKSATARWPSGRLMRVLPDEDDCRTPCASSPTFWNRTVPSRWPRFAELRSRLMDAGVPLKSPVAGVAMGLVKEGDKYAILTDIAGAEDHYGDMDFKVAGTREGITALQMDIKVGGITAQIMREALEQAQRGRLYILDKMNEAIASGRAQGFRQYAPRIYTLHIPVDKIRDVIGPGGKMIRSIIEQTGVKIDVEDAGKVNVASNDEASANKALADHPRSHRHRRNRQDLSGQGSPAGGFRRVRRNLPGTDGLLHISEVAEHRIKDVRDELKEGDQVLVKVLAVEGNRIRLSRKAILKEQRAKMGGGEAPVDGDGGGERQGDDWGTREAVPAGSGPITIVGGGDFPDEAEPNFNRDAPPQGHSQDRGFDRGGDRGGRGGLPVAVDDARVAGGADAVDALAAVGAGAALGAKA